MAPTDSTDQIHAISVIGLGKLGAPIAAALAARGFEVVGVDLAESKVEALERGEPPVFEPGLTELLADAGPRLRATTSIADAVRRTDATLIIVPTPSEPDGAFSLRHVLGAIEPIGAALRAKRDYHLVTLTSTVMPGATDGAVRAALERASGRRAGRDFGLCYSPEFVALGSVIRDFLHPDFLLIGQHDARSGDALERIYARACDPLPPVARLEIVNAELAKLAVNAFITTKITYANMLAALCEHLPGGDIEQVTHALGLDRRIGKHYLKGAVSYGGPCFPRDNRAITRLAEQLGTRTPLTQTVDRMNDDMVHRLADMTEAHRPRGGKVSVLGLAYKPESDVVEQSAGILLAEELCRRDVEVIAYDPVAMDNAKHAATASLRFAPEMAPCVEAGDVIVLTTPWPEFDALDGRMLRRPPGRPTPTVIDCWRRLDPAALGDGVDYVAVGIGPAGARRAAEDAPSADAVRAVA